MTHAYKVHFFHLIWSTKNREPMIDNLIKSRLYSYMGGIIERNKGTLLEIGGMLDHVHLLINLSNLDHFSSFLRDIKACSSGFIRKTFPEKQNFGWQQGFASISLCQTVLPAVRKYIQNQEEHHKVVTFEKEYLNILEQLRIKYDPRFVLD